MRTVSAPGLAPSTEINRKQMRPAQKVAPRAFGRALQGIWGEDAAIELAARSHSGVRIAEYKIAGTVKPNGIDIAVLVDAVTDEFR
jgi:hypothetical protein